MAGNQKTFALDNRNPNKGTSRGRAGVTDSLEKRGAARSIVVDRHGQIVSGNTVVVAPACCSCCAERQRRTERRTNTGKNGSVEHTTISVVSETEPGDSRFLREQLRAL